MKPYYHTDRYGILLDKHSPFEEKREKPYDS